MVHRSRLSGFIIDCETDDLAAAADFWAAALGCTVVCLVPSRTDTRWFHDYVWDVTTNSPRPHVEVRFLRGRLKFGDGTGSAPFPSMLVIFRPHRAG